VYNATFNSFQLYHGDQFSNQENATGESEDN
jgi:hypothetical protein